MWSFLKRHVWLSVMFAVLLYGFNRFFPADNVGRSWWWTLVLPNAMIAFIAHRESNRAKANQKLVMDAISERLCEGRLTEPDRSLALHFYPELRQKLYDAVVHGGSFKAGESLHLVLLKTKLSGTKEIEDVLPKLHAAPYDVPRLTPDEEMLLVRIGANNPSCAKVIVQWLFASDGEMAIERLQNNGAFAADDAKISEFILDLLPKLPTERYSQAVDYLKWRTRHLKGRTAVLRDLQDRLLDCEGQMFDDTVAVIGGINGEQGKAALDACWRELPRAEKRRRACVDHEIAALKERLMLAAQPNSA